MGSYYKLTGKERIVILRKNQEERCFYRAKDLRDIFYLVGFVNKT